MFSALPPPVDTDAVLADGTPLLAADSPGRHPLRRRTDSRDIVDVQAQVVPSTRIHEAVSAYQRACDLAPPYHPGLVVDIQA